MRDSPTNELYRWLLSTEGASLLKEIEKLPEDRLLRITRLRKHHSSELAETAVALLSLRKRAISKFQNAESLLFTHEGLEQATSSEIAKYRASKMPFVTTLDACCGVGGDAIALAADRPVIAVDSNPLHALCARANTISCLHPVRAICADVTSLDLGRLRRDGVRAAFFDPSRRQSVKGTRTRIKDAESYLPPLSWTRELTTHFPSVGVKVSPAIDDESIRAVASKTEFISSRGQCKEAVLWFGMAGEHLESADGDQEGYHATVLSAKGEVDTLSPFECEHPSISDPLEWIFEPDPAVIRAHLIPQITSLIGGAQIDPRVAYLTASSYAESPFTTPYRMLEWMPYHLKQLQHRVKSMGRRVDAIKLRGVPLKPDELIKTLKGTGNPSDSSVVVFIMRRGEKLMAMICELPG